MSARAAARLYAALLAQLPGVRVLSAEQLAAVAAVPYTGTDRVMEMENISWSLGYSPGRPSSAASRPGSTFGQRESDSSPGSRRCGAVATDRPPVRARNARRAMQERRDLPHPSPPPSSVAGDLPRKDS